MVKVAQKCTSLAFPRIFLLVIKAILNPNGKWWWKYYFSLCQNESSLQLKWLSQITVVLAYSSLSQGFWFWLLECIYSNFFYIMERISSGTLKIGKKGSYSQSFVFRWKFQTCPHPCTRGCTTLITVFSFSDFTASSAWTCVPHLAASNWENRQNRERP